MPIVKVETKYQVTLTTSVRESVGLTVGDLLEATVEGNKITLTPKSLIDRGIAESIEEYKKGKSYGSYDSAEGILASLHRNVKKRRTKNRSRSPR